MGPTPAGRPIGGLLFFHNPEGQKAKDGAGLNVSITISMRQCDGREKPILGKILACISQAKPTYR
jgi:hypothetical protein